jgi:hypothetical protein
MKSLSAASLCPLLIPPGDDGEAGHLLCRHTRPLIYMPRNSVRSTISFRFVVVPNVSPAWDEFKKHLERDGCEQLNVFSFW